MSLEYEGTSRSIREDLITKQEALTQSAQNFLIDVGRVAQQAEPLGLVISIKAYPFDETKPAGLVYVATPENSLATVLIRNKGEANEFLLRPIIKHRLYSHVIGVNQEEFAVSDDYKSIIVTVAGNYAKGHHFRYTETINEPRKANVVEMFARELRPISLEEFNYHFDNLERGSKLQKKVKNGYGLARFLRSRRENEY
jgi:hypothetical protein